MLTSLKRLATASLLLSILSLNVYAGIVSGTSSSGTSQVSSSFLTTTPTSSSGGNAPQCTCSSTGGNGTTSGSTGGNSTPTGSNSTTTSSSEKSTAGGSSAGPQFVIYSDKYVSNVLPPVDDVKGYTALILGFLLSSGRPADQAASWGQLDQGTRQKLKSQYNQAGIKLMVSAFGGTDFPTSQGADAAQTAQKMAEWVVSNDLDGIDVDYEDTTAMNAQDGKAEEWVSTFTKTLRQTLPQGKYIVTHAPMAPWFSSSAYKSGAYMTINKDVGSMIDWYNVQFYNQGDYTDCNSLINTASKNPGTALAQISKAGVSQDKLVIGKPATSADASNGYMDASTFAQCLQQAKGTGWNGGAMVWEYPDANAQWIQTVRSKSWPVS